MPAHAQSYIDPATVEYLDPANFHVGADSSGGPGSDPNPIVSNSEVFVADVPNNGIDNPLTLYFVVPNGQGAPIITAIKYGGVTPELSQPGRRHRVRLHLGRHLHEGWLRCLR